MEPAGFRRPLAREGCVVTGSNPEALASPLRPPASTRHLPPTAERLGVLSHPPSSPPGCPGRPGTIQTPFLSLCLWPRRSGTAQSSARFAHPGAICVVPQLAAADQAVKVASLGARGRRIATAGVKLAGCLHAHTLLASCLKSRAHFSVGANSVLGQALQSTDGHVSHGGEVSGILLFSRCFGVEQG